MTSSEAPIFLNENTVSNVLTWPLVIESVEEALKAVSSKNKEDFESIKAEAYQPQRTFTLAGQNGVLLTMPGFVSNYKLTKPTGTQETFHTLACKIVTGFSKNNTLKPPLPAILANILLCNPSTGKLECIISATQITAWRTAAASITATKCLYFKRFAHDAETHNIKLAIVGCGAQGRSHAFGMCHSFRVSHVKLWNRTTSKAEILAKDLRTQYAYIEKIEVAETAADCVADANVICVGTFSPTSLIDYNMLKLHNVHINTVGADKVHFGEIGQGIYDKSTVYVDSWASAKVELAALKANIVAEIGEIMNGFVPQPTATGITIFQNMGMAVEDATVGQAVFEAYKKIL